MAKNADPESGNQGLPPDPITGSSLSGPMVVSAVLLFLTLAWGLYDELTGTRPWKSYQSHFVTLYSSYLRKLGPRQAEAEKAVRSSAEYQKLSRQLKDAESKIAPRVAEIDRELSQVRGTLAVIKDPFQDARARIAALTYELDHTPDSGRKSSIRADIDEVKKQQVKLAFASGNDSKAARAENLTFTQLSQRFSELKSQESRLNAERAEITKESRQLRGKLNEYLNDHLTGLSQQQIEGLQRKMREFPVEIKQIHVEEAGLIDRCESCHVGIREPLLLTAADMGGQQVFVSHPNKTLLTVHDPNRFGCSPCHNGDGLATSSIEKGHGRHEHWLWPLFAKENSEAGCLQCHFNDRVLDNAPLLVRGRDLFEQKGCVGCHRYEGFDRESDTLSELRKDIRNLETQQKESLLEAERETKSGDTASSNDEAQKLYARADKLRLNASNMDAKIDALDRKSKYVMQDQKKVGPNLKDVRLKLRKEWIPVWLKDPPAFRPGTKMPRFRLTDEEIHALGAFIWQSGLEGPKPPQQQSGNAANGKELFETRGCLACHSMGEGDRRLGGDFAANLSRLGEKANFDYIVRWVHNPRERTRSYCAYEGKDLGPEDYTRKGLPFVADLEQSTCPNDGHQLQVQNLTVMPSLRLTPGDARDIATYLTSLKHADAAYPSDVSFMDDPQLAAKGKQLVSRYGCASCHEIRGLEEVQRIGTELTREASKPIEQLDFGLWQHKAEGEGWYDHKGFFEHKLKDPAVYDQGREKAPEDRLKMPNFQLTSEEIRALTTLLLGSMDSSFRGQFRTIPEQFRYIPTDQQRDLQEGWWVVKKYNCMGCHDIQPGQRAVLKGLPRYQDPDWKEQVPPSLMQEGARVDPEWLSRFLRNPALKETDTNRNGVRTYLKVRMPTFSFSPNEVSTLVRFFMAISVQQTPYVPTRLQPLNEKERQMARELFSSPGAPCLKCHLVGDPAHDRFATAPDFLMAKDRLKPAWAGRWMLDPQAISPGTAMPSGLFRREGDRWVFAGPTPPIFAGYDKDHVQLLVRYMFELTAEEQRRLVQRMPATGKGKASIRPGEPALRAAVSR